MKVYACLVGDLFHAGHVSFLRQARALGDYLLVGVASDEDCAEYKRKPICTLPERAGVVGACRFVDEVLLAPPPVVTAEFLDQHKIDLVVHGDDFSEAILRSLYGVALERGIYRSLPYTSGISTSEIITRIKARSDQELARKILPS